MNRIILLWKLRKLTKLYGIVYIIFLIENVLFINNSSNHENNKKHHDRSPFYKKNNYNIFCELSQLKIIGGKNKQNYVNTNFAKSISPLKNS